MNAAQIASVLNRLADLMELNGDNPFKVNAYRRAARAVENSRVPLSSLEGGPEQLPGVGKGTAAVIREIMETGRSKQLEELKEKLPEGLPELMSIQGLGPKSIHILYNRLGVTDVEELEQAVKDHRVRELPGFGEKKEKNILDGIRQYRQQPGRSLLVHALPVAEILLRRLQDNADVQRVEMAGSLRRMKETVKDADLVVATEDPESVAEQLVSMPEVIQVINQGETKVSVLVSFGFEIQVDVRLVAPDRFITALHHFTGSKEHNVRIRQRAKEFGWKVSEYGIFDPESGRELTFNEEEELYRMLHLPYMVPELREDRGEMDRQKENLPDLLEPEDYRGDLHMHTRWSDGTASVKEMAEAAMKRGYEYICITDHSQSLKVASGLTADDLKRQREEVDRVNDELEGITVLAGIEMDILPDGRLDFSDEVLEELDVVIASIHSSFKQDRETITRRILNAMENPHVHMIAHPTGRLINRRDPYAVDVDRIFETAAQTGTVLELNANPNRLDLKDTHLKRAKEEFGVTFTINTDAHSPEAFNFVRLGIATARRGWLESSDVINTLPLHRLKERIGKAR
ncbi:DNA polymerase/3'-5' exonuclease PolX [Paludifilum halophilum]|uniref:DNA-directed DNA polymerase n=1 Tax=Paludifilum halophilum TaxID=1642702 RepID=A0A235B7S6_9BACL|nr:DNA polymerase/3'-5' exonuclease PolX [Paludifilum halophilum]OYD08346.1 DNA polymerase/3'-5' exonuclease PolX [Paludifilum halophilum]